MTPDKDKPQRIIGLAWYKPNQWARLIEVSEDADRLEQTFLEWFEPASKRYNEMVRSKLQVRKIAVDVEELIEWCKRRGLPVSAASRALYVKEKTREEW